MPQRHQCAARRTNHWLAMNTKNIFRSGRFKFSRRPGARVVSGSFGATQTTAGQKKFVHTSFGDALPPAWPASNRDSSGSADHLPPFGLAIGEVVQAGEWNTLNKTLSLPPQARNTLSKRRRQPVLNQRLSAHNTGRSGPRRKDVINTGDRVRRNRHRVRVGPWPMLHTRAPLAPSSMRSPSALNMWNPGLEQSLAPNFADQCHSEVSLSVPSAETFHHWSR